MEVIQKFLRFIILELLLNFKFNLQKKKTLSIIYNDSN